jgi:hypothetical protein
MMRRWFALFLIGWMATLPRAALAQDTPTPIQVLVTVILVPASPTSTFTPTVTLTPTPGPSPTPTASPTPTFEVQQVFAPASDGGLGGVVKLEVTAGEVAIALLLFALLVVLVLNFILRLRGR